tara:strand:- start:389 stop:1519 length:1131 start_codon:yes stop_codon:yes gene_type:complete
MKKLSILLFALVAFTGLNSCTSDDDVVFIAQPDPEGISFVNSFNANYVLTAATATNIAERFVWNTVDFDVPTNITYALYGSTDALFENADLLGTTGENNLAVTVRQLINLAEDAGLDNDPNTDAPNMGTLYFQVQAYAGSDGGNGLSETSEVKSITVVLPETGEEEEVLKNFFMVGDATAAGWNPNNNNTPLFRDGTNSDVYHFTGRFAGGAGVEGFKLLEVLNVWDSQWGIKDGNLTSREILGSDPGAFPVAADAYYTFTMDIDAMTYTFVPYAASGATTYATIGIIGDSTPDGWDADQDMTKSEFDPHIWFIKGIELNDGEMKFRADNDWAVNWGGNTAMSGLATPDGPNVPVSGGTYDIWFNDLTGRYIFIKL